MGKYRHRRRDRSAIWFVVGWIWLVIGGMFWLIMGLAPAEYTWIAAALWVACIAGNTAFGLLLIAVGSVIQSIQTASWNFNSRT